LGRGRVLQAEKVDRATRASTIRFWVVAVAPLVSGTFPSYLMGTLAVSMGADLGFTTATLGLLTAMRFVVAAAGSAQLGRLAERIGAAHGLRIAAGTVAVLAAAVAAFVHDVWALAVILAVCGLALGLVQPAADLWVARGISSDRQGFAFGVKQAAVPAAALLAGLAVPVVLEPFGWRWVWALAAVFALLATCAIPLRTERTTSRRAAGHPPADRRLAPLIWLAATFAFGSVAVVSVTTFLVLAAVDQGMGEGAAGVLFAVSSVVGIVGRLLFGRLADRTRRDLLLVLAMLQVLGACVFILFALVSGAWYFLAAPLAFAVGLGWPGVLMLATVRAYSAEPASATSIVNIGAYLGSIGGPIAFGLIATRWGFAAGWAYIVACLLLAAAAALAGRSALRRGPRITRSAECLAAHI
jgi:MFS family permease